MIQCKGVKVTIKEIIIHGIFQQEHAGSNTKSGRRMEVAINCMFGCVQ